MSEPKFQISYRGEAEYMLDGIRYRVRSFAMDDGYYATNSDGTSYFETGIEPFVGTVAYAYCYHNDENRTIPPNMDAYHCFPPDEVIAAFAKEHPGIVGARYVAGSWNKVEYTAPRNVSQWHGDLCAQWHIDDMKRFYPNE